MASLRLYADPRAEAAVYHCLSRVVDRRFVFGEAERERFVRFLRAYERFCQVKVLTYCILSNHFHLLVEVPKRPEAKAFSDDWLLRQARFIYAGVAVQRLEESLQRLRRRGEDTAAEELKERYLRRMWDVSQFMKELKQRFSLWFNKRAQRKGTLWEERFTSVLVEGHGPAVALLAAYIDLNPVRAKIVDDPKDYRWCGYAEAVAGGRRALEGLKVVAQACVQEAQERANPHLQPPEVWLKAYRVWLYGIGEERRLMNGEVMRAGLKREAVAEVLQKRGELSRGELLRCRVRYFSRGAVLGSREFVEAVFALRRGRFGQERQTGARPMKGADFGALCALRDLRQGVLPVLDGSG